MLDRAEICTNVEALRGELENLAVRGLRTAGPSEHKTLKAMHSEFSRVGAEHLAARIQTLSEAMASDDRSAPAALMRAQTSLHVFERVLTLDAASQMLNALAPQDGTAPTAATPRETPAAPPIEDRKKLLALLDDLTKAVEDLLSTGLTTASDATRQKLDVSFKEASRLKLLRLGAALRYVNEELGRFLAESAQFSGKRFALFLNRSWLLARGLRAALEQDDTATVARLLMAGGAAAIPVSRLDAVVLGTTKRAGQNSCAFDFKLRVVADSSGVKAGQRLTWSTVFALKTNITAEAFLHLPQPQKFKPIVLLEGKPVTITDAAVTLDDSGAGRLLLSPKTTVSATGKPFKDWARFQSWDLPAAAKRIAAYRPTPLDLAVEMQEEVILRDWEIGAPIDRGRADQKVFPITTPDGLSMDAVVSTAPDGAALQAQLERLTKGTRPPLFGLMHYELCRLVLQPLATFDEDKMTYLTISDEKIDLKGLLGTLDLRG